MKFNFFWIAYWFRILKYPTDYIEQYLDRSESWSLLEWLSNTDITTGCTMNWFMRIRVLTKPRSNETFLPCIDNYCHESEGRHNAGYYDYLQRKIGKAKYIEYILVLQLAKHSWHCTYPLKYISVVVSPCIWNVHAKNRGH